MNETIYRAGSLNITKSMRCLNVFRYLFMFKMKLNKPISIFAILVIATYSQAALAQTGKFKVLRTWTDSTGQYKLNARLVSVREEQVELKTDSGEEKKLPIGRLSKKDREHVLDYSSALFAELKSKVRETVFAKDALQIFLDYDSKGMISSGNRVYVDSQLALLKEMALDNAILLNNDYIPFEDLAAIKANSLKDVNDWIETVADNGRAKKDQKLIKKGIAEDPTSLEGSIILGIWLEVALADHAGAQRHLERAVDKADRYAVIASNIDRQNRQIALNNLAVSYAKDKKTSKAIKTWNKVVGVANSDVPDAVPSNVANLDRLLASNNSPIIADIDDRKSLRKLAAKAGAQNDYSGWSIMVPETVNSVDFAIDQRFATVDQERILDERCINCDGSTKVFCPVKTCKKGGIKVPVIGPKYFAGEYIGDGIVDWTFKKCSNCSGVGVVICPCCSGRGVQD